jgi:non-ribosomal peptide synthetase component F
MMAIEMVGGIYCPLSPLDPQHRLHALIQQIQSRVVLVHYLTKTKFQNDVMSVNIDSVLINNNDIESDVDFNRLSSVLVTSDNIAYIIFTSGSTGTPKAVSDKTDNELVLYHYLIFDRLKFDIEILLSVCIPWLSLM